MKVILVDIEEGVLRKQIVSCMESSANSMNLRLAIMFPVPHEQTAEYLIPYYNGSCDGARKDGYDVLAIVDSYINAAFLSVEEYIKIHRHISSVATTIYRIATERTLPSIYHNVAKVDIDNAEQIPTIINKMFS